MRAATLGRAYSDWSASEVLHLPGCPGAWTRSRPVMNIPWAQAAYWIMRGLIMFLIIFRIAASIAGPECPTADTQS